MEAGLWERVVLRDARVIYRKERPGVPFERWIRAQKVICIVRLLDPPASASCSGRQTVDHVKDSPGMSIKAPDDLWHLCAMCQYHNVESPPSKSLRMKERSYLGLIPELDPPRPGSVLTTLPIPPKVHPIKPIDVIYSFEEYRDVSLCATCNHAIYLTSDHHGNRWRHLPGG